MRRFNENGLVYYQFDLMAGYPELAHGIFTRLNGENTGPCGGFNLSFSAGEPESAVLSSLERVSSVLNLAGLAFVGQIHGREALVIKTGQEYRPRCKKDIIKGYDALMTRNQGQGLLVKLADCQGILLFDPVTKAVAVAHSGWRGSAADIIGHTVRKLAAEFKVNPADLLAGIGPSLGPCCAEFVNHRRELPAEFQPYQVRENYFDFWAISRHQLLKAGVRPENIETAGLCTVCEPEFYSYRRDKTPCRFGLAAGLV